MEKPPSPWETRRYAWQQLCPESRDTEDACGLDALWWTFLLLVMHHFFTTNSLFVGMQNMGHEWQWAICCGTVAILWMLAKLFPAPAMRFLASAAGTGIFAFIAASIAQSSPVLWHSVPATTGFGIYARMAFFNLRCMTRIGKFIVTDLLKAYHQRFGGFGYFAPSPAAQHNGGDGQGGAP